MASLQEDLLLLGNRDASMLSSAEIQTKIESTMTKMFTRVGAMLLISFGVAFGISSWMVPIPFTMAGFWISAIGWFGLILRISRRWQTMSYQTISGALIAFALLEWYGLTGVFAAYGLWSIQQVFLTTSLLFIWLATAGNYLHIDISKVGSILTVSLIALIVAMVINMFWGNEQFNIWISIIGVVIFSGLIIYDMNVLKQQALVADERLPLLMAMSMFLNFINLFLFLLRLMGGSRD
jgi:FtsH-binding integral membrane protein